MEPSAAPVDPQRVTIVVKNVYAPTETQQFDVQRSLTVRALKQLVHEQFPTQPAVNDQKLIFGGKICEDDHVLEKILTQVSATAWALCAGRTQGLTGRCEEQNQVQQQEDGAATASVVFHLLVTSTLPKGTPMTPVAKPHTAPNTPRHEHLRPERAMSNDLPRRVMAASAGRSSSAPLPMEDAPASAPAAGAAAQPNAHVNPGTAFPYGGLFGGFPMFAQPPAPSAMPNTGASNNAQQHAAQTYFAQQMLLQQQAAILMQIQQLQQLKMYHEALGRSAATHTSTAGVTQHAASAHHTPPAAPAPAAPAAHAPQLFVRAAFFNRPVVVAAGVAPQAAAAQPAQAERPPGMLRELLRETAPLLDLRLAFKMAFMLFIFGQDTPMDRLVVLGLMAVVAYLHITGILGKIYEVVKRSSQDNANENAPAAPADGTPPAPPQVRGYRRWLRVSSDRGIVQDVKSFFSAFVLSLVPAWHPEPLSDVPGFVRPEPVPAEADNAAAGFPLQGI
ncbi:TPA: hypothetical protein N0F65_012702 [Lagenidium giganteum]|uniref:Ubiquitin-like domain-containing protein n=1 Tax=Lagenidium giganteum TaxID=4803 RepID=A0AAV2YGC0_9STRA|nr:TPA: hypothetical protein N0F65_012702 [Lagenidium giganteum]